MRAWRYVAELGGAFALALSVGVASGFPALAEPNVTAVAAADAPRNLTSAQWREDLNFMASEMKRRHKNLYHTITQQQFDAAVAELDRAIPSLKRNEIIVGMMRIAAMVGDGHTRVDPRKDPNFGFRSLPLRLYTFDDGLYVRAAAPAYANLVGAEVTAFNGVPTGAAIKRIDPIVSKDNAMALPLFAPVYLNMPDILEALKLSPSTDMAVLTLRKSGRTWTAKIPAGDVAEPWPDDTDGSFIDPKGWVDARRTAEPPLWLQAPLDFHRLVPLPTDAAIYTQLNEVTDIPGETLPQYGRKIRDAAAAAHATKVIVDLRLNYGGNMDLRNGYTSELIKTEDEDTQLFVLSARGSFSATEGLLVDLRRLTHAVFVGEPASSKPNSYGDAYRSMMPNSGIAVRTSIRWNQLAGVSKAPWTGVDVAAPLTFAQYAAGRDPALEAVLAYSPRPPLSDQLVEAAKAGGVEGALGALATYRSDLRNRYQDFALTVPRAADRLYVMKQPEASFAVAEQAAHDYPASVDAWLVLAFIANLTHHRDVALEAVHRTLALEPDNRPAQDLLERMGASKS